MSRKNLSVKIKIPKLIREKLNNKKINKIYKKFEKSLDLKDNFIVAVSGGADSLALAFFSKVYSFKKGINPKYYIVDHKLRSDSSVEAKKVRKVLKKFSIKAEILTWYGTKPKKNIQSLARKKRYQLLFDKCKKFKIVNLLLGHHQNDLIENFFIRILRGSGLKGLTSLDKKTSIDNINLLRPLLEMKKEDLMFVTKSVFGFFVSDPSNNDDKFQRIRVRKLIKVLKFNGLDNKKFNKTITNLKYSNFVINSDVMENLKNNTFFSNNKNKMIINNEFFNQPYEIVFRSFSNCLKIVGKRYYNVRGKKLDNIILKIRNNSNFKATLGGCIIKKVNQTIIVSKEH